MLSGCNLLLSTFEIVVGWKPRHHKRQNVPSVRSGVPTAPYKKETNQIEKKCQENKSIWAICEKNAIFFWKKAIVLDLTVSYRRVTNAIGECITVPDLHSLSFSNQTSIMDQVGLGGIVCFLLTHEIQQLFRNLSASHRTWNVTFCDENVMSLMFIPVTHSKPGLGSMGSEQRYYMGMT